LNLDACFVKGPKLPNWLIPAHATPSSLAYSGSVVFIAQQIPCKLFTNLSLVKQESLAGSHSVHRASACISSAFDWHRMAALTAPEEAELIPTHLSSPIHFTGVIGFVAIDTSVGNWPTTALPQAKHGE
jgi:hypothetical protein